VQAGGLGLVTNPDLRTEPPDQLVDGTTLGSTYVGGCEDTERNAAAAELCKRLLENTQAVPADERAQEVYSIGTTKLCAQFRRQ
jgi:hypothetical protein